MIPDTSTIDLTPDQRTALARFDDLSRWSNPYLTPISLASLGGEFRGRSEFLDALRRADSNQLAACLSDLTALQDRYNAERAHAEANDPAEAMTREMFEESNRAARFRATDSGRLERVIELLEQLVERGSQA
jgi:hypothetical protein